MCKHTVKLRYHLFIYCLLNTVSYYIYFISTNFYFCTIYIYFHVKYIKNMILNLQYFGLSISLLTGLIDSSEYMLSLLQRMQL